MEDGIAVHKTATIEDGAVLKPLTTNISLLCIFSITSAYLVCEVEGADTFPVKIEASVQRMNSVPVRNPEHLSIFLSFVQAQTRRISKRPSWDEERGNLEKEVIPREAHKPFP